MTLAQLKNTLLNRYHGSFFPVTDVAQRESHAKEYVHRLSRQGTIQRVCWGWYYVPAPYQDVWEFLIQEKGKKVVIKQTAASLWNEDFVHRNIYHLAVEDPAYKRALEAYAKAKEWIFEIDVYDKLDRIPITVVDGLRVEAAEPCLVECVAEWSFVDAVALLYARRQQISSEDVKTYSRWKRVKGTNIRAWQAIKYACYCLNEQADNTIFPVRKTSLDDDSMRELIEEAVGKVVEFA